MSRRYTFTTPYKDAYEIVDRDIDKAMKPEDVADLLNQQDKRIKELEEKLNNVDYYKMYCELRKTNDDMIKGLTEQCEQLKQQLKDCEKRYKKAYQEGLLQKQFDKDMKIAELKQQLHDLSNKIVEDIKNELETSKLKLRIVGIDGYSYTDSFLQTILKKYGGEDE